MTHLVHFFTFLMANVRRKKKSGIVMANDDNSFGIYNPRNKNPNVFAGRVMDFLDEKGANILNGNCWMLIFEEDFKDKQKRTQLKFQKLRMGSITWYKMAPDCYVAVSNSRSMNIEYLTSELMICLKNPIPYEIWKLTRTMLIESSRDL